MAWQAAAPEQARRTASDTAVRATVLAAAGVFALAAVAHVLRYVLLLINRTTLLHPLVANGALLMGILVSLAAIAAVIAAAAVATSWLIGRRAAVFGLHGNDDPRPEWALWAGCLIPVVNLVWAPVFVIELARAEHSQARLKSAITTWWIAWVFCTGICLWAIWTSGATDPQGVADNTVTVIIAYLAGVATLVLLLRVVDAFIRKPVQRPLHRWVIVAEGDNDSPGASGIREPDPAPIASPDSGAQASAHHHDEFQDVVESGDREPAA